MKKTPTAKRPAALRAGITITEDSQGARVEVRGNLAIRMKSIARREGVPAEDLLARILLKAFGNLSTFEEGKIETPGPFACYLCDVARGALKIARNNRERCEAEAVVNLLYAGYATIADKPFYLPTGRGAK